MWFDAFASNVDRTARNPNLLCWHRNLWLIDHGAALYFHHAWDDPAASGQSSFAAVKDHVLLRWATQLAAAGERLAARCPSASAGTGSWHHGAPCFRSRPCTPD